MVEVELALELELLVDEEVAVAVAAVLELLAEEPVGAVYHIILDDDDEAGSEALDDDELDDAEDEEVGMAVWSLMDCTRLEARFCADAIMSSTPELELDESLDVDVPVAEEVDCDEL